MTQQVTLPLAHASGRFDAPDASVRDSLAHLAVLGAKIISVTEAAHRDLAALAPKGWTVVQETGPGKGECGVLAHPDVSISGHELIQLTKGDKGASAKFGMYRHDQNSLAVTARYQGAWFRLVVVHTPSHLHSVYGLALWLATLRSLAAHAGARTIIAGDWNAELRFNNVRRTDLVKAFPHHNVVAPKGATHDIRTIDGFLVPKGWPTTQPSTLPQRAGLDHKAVRVGVKLTVIPEKGPIVPKPKPYALTTHDGHTVDVLTDSALVEAEKRLGYPLTVLQGSYNKGGVGASAGTHDGGGAVDLAPWDWQNKVKVLRDIGFAAWHRPAIPGLWGEHIHCILIGNKKLSPAAAEQVTQYERGLDGLADHAVDSDPYRPRPIPVWRMP